MSRAPLLVTDACFWIDLDAAGLVEAVFGLAVEWAAPDAMIKQELRRPEGAELQVKGLVPMRLSGGEVTRALAVRERAPALSAIDAMVLVLAESRGAVLVTGEKLLRRVARQRGVECHGTLWVLDILVSQRILTGPKAAAALARMLSSGSRFPAAECNKLSKRWLGAGERD